jgi:hypothetical protein
MPRPDAITGGCQCGAVRYRVDRLGTSAVCHCRMCQKAYGSYFGPLVVAHDVTWTRGAPKYFRSSNVMQRGFCAECGTPLCCIDADGMIELSGGSLDHPELALPTVTYNTRDKTAAFDLLPALPRNPREDLEAVANAAIVSHQHPDHDTSVWPPVGGFAA